MLVKARDIFHYIMILYNVRQSQGVDDSNVAPTTILLSSITTNSITHIYFSLCIFLVIIQNLKKYLSLVIIW